MLTLVKIINTLNNAVLLKKYKVVIKHFNTFSLNVLKLLQQLNIIDSYLVNDTFTTCTIFLNTATNNVFFQKILFISQIPVFVLKILPFTDSIVSLELCSSARFTKKSASTRI